MSCPCQVDETEGLNLSEHPAVCHIKEAAKLLEAEYNSPHPAKLSGDYRSTIQKVQAVAMFVSSRIPIQVKETAKPKPKRKKKSED